MASDRTTNFSLACSFLSQMVKDNGFAPAKGKLEPFQVPVTRNLLPAVSGNNTETEVKNTLELFPQHPAASQEGKPQIPETKCRQQNSSQLTIFYGGKVLVFDQFSAEKADELMQFASKEAPVAHNFRYVVPSAQHHMLAQARFPDLPLTRKASLQRFFDMRRNRIKSKAPYDVAGSPRKAAPANSEESSTLRCLIPEASKSSSLNLSSDCSR